MSRRGNEIKVKLILASSKHIDSVLALIKQYYKFDGIRFGAEKIRGGLDLLLRHRSLGRVWLIRVGRHDAGYIILTFGFDLEFGGRQATITDFYIVDRFRGSKLGSKTLTFVETVCREMGVAALELQVERDNVGAQGFYRKLGFEPHDRIPLSKQL